MMHHNMQDVINENKRLVLEVANLHTRVANLEAQLEELNKLIDWLLITPQEQINKAIEFANQTTSYYREGVNSLIRDAFMQP